jgi:hypothetical protein
MDRTSGQLQVKVSLLRNISLKIRPLSAPEHRSVTLIAVDYDVSPGCRARIKPWTYRDLKIQYTTMPDFQEIKTLNEYI